MRLKKATFGGLNYDHDTRFEFIDIFADNKYVGFAEKLDDSFVFWRVSDIGKNFIGGHIGRYLDGVKYKSLDELKEDLETHEENG